VPGFFLTLAIVGPQLYDALVDGATLLNLLAIVISMMQTAPMWRKSRHSFHL
jgi:hypothetical protein